MAKKQTAVVLAQMEPVQIPLDFTFDGIETKHATEMAVSQDGHVTTFCFFAVEQPFLVGTPEQQQAQAKKIKSVPAKCVARVSIPTSKLAGFGQQQQAPINGVRMLPPHQANRR